MIFWIKSLRDFILLNVKEKYSCKSNKWKKKNWKDKDLCRTTF